MTDARPETPTPQGDAYDRITIDRIARVAHEVNRAYCAAIGDDTQAPYNQAPEWQRASARAGVDFHLMTPNAGPEGSHVAWMTHKLADGWQYGPIKDEAKKEHPCLVPFEQLPHEQKVKDYLFRAVVHAMR